MGKGVWTKGMTWRFSDHHDPAYDPPEIIPGTTAPHDMAMMDRHPLIYHEGQNKLYVGQGGTHHWNLHKDFDLPANLYDPDVKKGIAWQPSAQGGRGFINWYQPPKAQPIIEKVLNDHLQLGLDPEAAQPDQDDWDFHHSKNEYQVTQGTTEGINPDDDYEGFRGRQPILYFPATRRIYVGQPNTYHSDLNSEFELWHDRGEIKGYAGGGPEWGSGPLSWYGRPPIEHGEIAEALAPHFPGRDLLSAPAPVDDDDWGEDDDDDAWDQSYSDPEHVGKVAADLDDFRHWWDKEKPLHSDEAKKMAEYAAAEKLSRDEAEDWLQDHKKDIKDDFEAFKKSFLHKFDRLT